MAASYGVGSSANFWCVVSNGAAENALDSGVAFTLGAATDFDLQYVVTNNGANISFFINGIQVCSGMTITNKPAVTTALNTGWQLANTAAVIKKLKFSHSILTYR